jgi:hypothetical protein
MATAFEQLACENSSENILFAALVSPARAFFGFSQHETLFALAWAYILILWLLI